MPTPWRYRVYQRKGTVALRKAIIRPCAWKTSRRCPFSACSKRLRPLHVDDLSLYEGGVTSPWRHGDLTYKSDAFCLGEANRKRPTASFRAWATGHGPMRKSASLLRKGIPNGQCRCTSGHLVPHRRTLQETGGSPQPHCPAHGRCPRIELFARSRARGWDVWGNEATGSIQGWPPQENLREVS